MHIFKSISGITSIVSLLFAILFASLPTDISAGVQDSDEGHSFLKGLAEYNAGNYDNAQKIFSRLINVDTTNDALFFYSANIHFFRGELTDAATLMERALMLDTLNHWYRNQLARIYLASGETDKAISHFEVLRQRHPKKVELYEPLIELYAQKNETVKAGEIVDDIETNLGKSEASGLTRYNLMIFEKRQQEAFEFLKDFDKEYGTPRTATILGDYYSTAQNDTMALAYYGKALSADPKFAPALFGQAEIYRIKGDFDPYFENIYLFMADKTVNPSMKSGYIKQLLSGQRFVQTFLPQIDTLMNIAYQTHRPDSNVAYPYAMFSVQKGEMDKGLSVLKENLETYPDSEDAHREYLSLLYYMNMWDSLAVSAGRALALSPDNPGFMELSGIALAQSGKLKDAIAVFKKLIVVAEGDSATFVRALSLIGDLYYQDDNIKAAFRYYKKTLRFEPEHLPTLNNYAYFLSERGKQPKKALEMSQKTVEKEPENFTYLDTYAWILHLLGRDTEAKAALKKCMIYGGSENATILDHYAEVLYALKEYDLASIYWSQADKLDPSLGIAAKAEEKLKNRNR